MRQLVDHRDRRNIHRVARVRFKSADAALAQNHLVISARQNVFRREQPLFERRRNAALQQCRLAQFPDFAQQVEVLHIARADLQDIGIRAQQRNLRRVHHLADHEKAAPVRRLAQQLQPFFAQSLETIR